MTLKPIPSASELRLLTEPQIDEHFANVYEEEYRLEQERHTAVMQIYPVAGARRLYGHGERWSMTFSEAMDRITSLADNSPGSDAARVLRGIAASDRALTALAEGPQAVLDAEYGRRGGWTRAYLVTDGHVHKTRRCSSCNNGQSPTRFSWMIDYSGKSEEEIIQAAGHRACTICYPSAPVGRKAPRSVMLTPEEIARDGARADAAQAKEARAAAKAAKAITDSDGSPLKVYTWTKKAHQKQTRAGALVDVPEQEFFDTLETLHSARGWLTDQFEDRRGNGGGHRDLDKVARAIGAKEGKSPETVIEEARTRSQKRKR